MIVQDLLLALTYNCSIEPYDVNLPMSKILIIVGSVKDYKFVYRLFIVCV
jgi:hypothetical protein